MLFQFRRELISSPTDARLHHVIPSGRTYFVWDALAKAAHVDFYVVTQKFSHFRFHPVGPEGIVRRSEEIGKALESFELSAR